LHQCLFNMILTQTINTVTTEIGELNNSTFVPHRYFVTDPFLLKLPVIT